MYVVQQSMSCPYKNKLFIEAALVPKNILKKWSVFQISKVQFRFSSHITGGAQNVLNIFFIGDFFHPLLINQ